MSRVWVVGAGVIGSSYAALLAASGVPVTLVARGHRLAQLQRDGLRARVDGESLTAAVTVAASLAPEDADTVLVAVRGDQLESVLDDLAACRARAVLMFANPLNLRAEVEHRIGRDCVVWCFSGLGGSLVAGEAVAHRVRQQATVVETEQPASGTAVSLLQRVDPHLHREPDMASWLDTHTVFVAAMAAILLGDAMTTHRQRLDAAARLVRAMRQAFAALTDSGVRITPANLQLIFVRMPAWFATAYWARQLGASMVSHTMAPHARATRDTEQRAVCARAVDLVGDAAPDYRRLVAPFS